MSGVLVTGASGFVGVPVLRCLTVAGREVHALSRSTAPPAVAGVVWHHVDLGDTARVEAVIGDLRPERLIHLAWYVEHGRFWSAPENVLWVERSLQLLRAFVSAGGRRAVMLGTCAEYDWTQADAPFEETRSAIAPATLYGAAKDGLRRVATAYAEGAGCELAWGRLFFLYGPDEAPGRLVVSVIRALLAGETIETTAGAQRRDFLHVEDVARAVAELLASEATGPVNIASGEAVPVAAVLDSIADAIGRPELVLRGARAEPEGDPPLLVADVTRLREEVGFRPGRSLDEGIAATIDSLRASGRAAT
jgi:nucleoside-diphosphate-sugar epimerase